MKKITLRFILLTILILIIANIPIDVAAETQAPIDAINAFLSPELAQILVGLFGLGWAISEYLGSTERFKANSVVQAIRNGFKFILGKA